MTEGRMPALSAERVSMGIEELKSRHGPPPWAAPLVSNDRFVVMVICQAPGHRNDWHYHLADRQCDADGLGDPARQRDRPTLAHPLLPIVMRTGCVWEMLSFPHADHPSTMLLPARYPVSSGCFSTASRSNSSTAYSGPGSAAISSRARIQIDPWRRLTRDGADRVAASRGAGAAD